MEISPENVPWQSMYKILIGTVVPRPIGWVSSQDEAGQANLAPFSFYTVVCGSPPTVLFCPMVRASDGKIKDTLRNVRATGEFVVNAATEALAAAVNLSAVEFEAQVNEFEIAGLTAAPSVRVRPPRVAESPINLECRVTQIVDLGDAPGAGSVVIGQVVYAHIAEAVLIGSDKIDLEQLKPIARLAGSAYARVTDVFEMARPPKPGF